MGLTTAKASSLIWFLKAAIIFENVNLHIFRGMLLRPKARLLVLIDSIYMYSYSYMTVFIFKDGPPPAMDKSGYYSGSISQGVVNPAYGTLHKLQIHVFIL